MITRSKTSLRPSIETFFKRDLKLALLIAAMDIKCCFTCFSPIYVHFFVLTQFAAVKDSRLTRMKNEAEYLCISYRITLQNIPQEISQTHLTKEKYEKKYCR